MNALVSSGVGQARPPVLPCGFRKEQQTASLRPYQIVTSLSAPVIARVLACLVDLAVVNLFGSERTM